MATELTGYGNQLRMFGGGNTYFNTADLVEFEMQVLDMELNPLLDRKDKATVEKNAWTDFRNSLQDKLVDLDTIRFYDMESKSVNYSEEGVVKVNASNNAKNQTYDVHIDSIAKSHIISSDRQVNSTAALGIEGSFSISGSENITVNADMSLHDIAQSIENSDAAVEVNVIDNRLVLTNSKEGKDNTLTLNDTSGNVISQLGLIDGNGMVKNEIQEATNAVFTVEGIQIERNTNTVDDVIDGVEFELLKEDKQIQVGIEDNYDEVVNQVEDFVSHYNKLVNQINDLTEKESIFQGDFMMSQLKRELSNLMNHRGDNNEMLYNIGLQFSESNDGTIEFDKSSFEEKMAENPKTIDSLMFGENSVSRRFHSLINQYASSNGLASTQIESLENTINRIDSNIERKETQLEVRKESMIKKYSQLEAMMTELNISKQYMEAQIQSWNNSK